VLREIDSLLKICR